MWIATLRPPPISSRGDAAGQVGHRLLADTGCRDDVAHARRVVRRDGEQRLERLPQVAIDCRQLHAMFGQVQPGMRAGDAAVGQRRSEQGRT